ncbi:MAG: hypothetical protein PWP24_559 [Clostridiales bacterium]|nr:hypothetical protein [Clostridiales bacterium]
MKLKYQMRKAFFLFLFTLFFLSGCQKGSATNNQVSATPTTQIPKDESASELQFTGVVLEYNDTKKTITVFDTVEKKDFLFSYTSGTDVENAYDEIITVDQISIGEMVDVTYKGENQSLVKLQVSKSAWVYRDVRNLVTDKTNQRMQISGHNYWYDEGLKLFSEELPIELLDLNDQDELTIRGLGSQICSIVVTLGHGYIHLVNYTDFIGGTIEVGYGIIRPITEDMMVVAREGEYKVVLENGELVANETVKLDRNEEITLDMSDYKMPKSRIGYVRFDIEPYGADLYINGTQVDYLDPVKLNYGTHKVQVSMNGYDDFAGILTIAESTPTISIHLAEGTYGVEGETTDSSNSTDSQANEASNDSAGTTIEQSDTDTTPSSSGQTVKDEEHTITVQAPAGASLYLNGELKGTIPVSFTKEIGTHVFVITQTGYITKSYSVEVLDDGENAVFSFPDMIEMQ